MPVGRPQTQTSAAPPSSRNTATYSNKDGSKYITIPKNPSDQQASPLSHFAEPPPPEMPSKPKPAAAKQAQAKPTANPSAGVVSQGQNGGAPPTVNRKKQKRRQKQAARAAEQEALNEATESRQPTTNGHAHAHAHSQLPNSYFENGEYAQANPQSLDYPDQEYDDQDQDYYTDDDEMYRNTYYDPHNPANTNVQPSFVPSSGNADKKKSKKKKQKHLEDTDGYSMQPPAGANGHISRAISHLPPPPQPPLPLSISNPSPRISKDRIWNTSTQEERERIKEFWLGLGEEDRRSLVKVEKEAVLRKMKEQQKHSCSCTVCGRKRTAIEEELEVLYDAYYEELESYANHQQGALDGIAPPVPSRRYNPVSRLPPPGQRSPHLYPHQAPAGRIAELDDEEEELEDEDSFETDADDLSDELDDDPPPGAASDFFSFGNSLTVQGGILTVADDLLKNDGKKFIDMMEQLAESRMRREEEAQNAAYNLGHPSLMPQHTHTGHNHQPPPEEDEYDDEEEDEYDSQEDEYDDEEDMEEMTEQQRMEEGRRMFQIFAARMFEQRVLTAYREKVAKERQQKLLEELAEEEKVDAAKEAKKAKEAQRKKEKKRQQKLAKEEEKARKDAEKAAEEAAARAVEAKKAEELRLRKEEQRKKREAEKRQLEEERQRKEAEKQKRQQEERDRQAEAERKQREQKEKEKRKRDEQKRKEREEREVKEKEAKHRKEREEAERKDREAKLRADQQARDNAPKEEPHSTTQAARRGQPNISVPMPAGLAANNSTGFQSPHLQIATPAIPKAPGARQRQASQQGSVHSSPKTPQVTHGSSQSTSPGMPLPPHNNLGPIGPPGKSQTYPTHNPPFPATSSIAPLSSMAAPTAGLSGMTPLGINGLPLSQLPLVSTLQQQHRPIGSDMAFQQPQQPPGLPANRGFVSPGQMTYQNSFPLNNSGAQYGPGSSRGLYQLPMNGPPGMPNPHINQSHPLQSHSQSHSRQPSGSLDQETSAAPGQPIARPTPIQRPSSATPQQKAEEERSRADIDDLSNHLGSSALLGDDVDEPVSMSGMANGRRGSQMPSLPRQGFGASPPFPATGGSALDGFGIPPVNPASMWSSQAPFSGTNLQSGAGWSSTPGAGWSSQSTFSGRAHTSRPIAVRLLVCLACKQLGSMSHLSRPGSFLDANTVLQQVDNLRPPHEAPISRQEMLTICETEGNDQNGGGVFMLRSDNGQISMKYEPDDLSLLHHRRDGAGAAGGVGGGGGRMAPPPPGDIGSPVPGAGVPVFSSGGPRMFHHDHGAPGAGVTSPSVL